MLGKAWMKLTVYFASTPVQGDPVDYVDDMSVNMQLYPPQHYITGEQLLTNYKPEVSQNMVILLLDTVTF